MECLKFDFVLLYDIHDTWMSNHTIRNIQPKYHEDKCVDCRTEAWS